jgi:hypothetical protein
VYIVNTLPNYSSWRKTRQPLDEEEVKTYRPMVADEVVEPGAENATQPPSPPRPEPQVQLDILSPKKCLAWEFLTPYGGILCMSHKIHPIKE